MENNMNINEVLDIGKEIEMNESVSEIMGITNKLGKMSWDAAKKFLRQKAVEFVSIIKNDPYIDEKNVLRIINTKFGTNFSNINSVFANGITESLKLNEGKLGDWWKEASGNMYGALSFYPLLTVFLELDKIIKDQPGANIKAMIIYFLIWILIVTGKVVSGMIVKKQDIKASIHPSQVGR